MWNKLILILSLALALLLLVTNPTSAQTDAPPEGTPEGRTGEVKGTIVNRSPGASVLESMAVMLHTWDQNYMGKGMLHGQSAPDGSFHFIEVIFEPNLLYAVMANYEGSTYYSDIVVLNGEETSLEFEVPIYDTTTDLTHAQLDQVHILFFFNQGGLEVTEVYILSNLGDYTVKDAVLLDDGLPATLKFPLPENAANVTFDSNDNDRFVQYPGGFADSSPLVPGDRSNQIVVRYVLPYENKLSYTFTPPLATNGVKFLVLKDPNINIEGDELVFDGEQTMQDGMTFDVYSQDPLQTNENVNVTISGEPTTIFESEMEAGEKTSRILSASSLEIGIGGIILGFALIVVGVIWWRNTSASDDEDIEDIIDLEDDLHDFVSEIVHLDDTHQSGELSEDEYEQRRAELLQKGRILLVEESPAQHR